MEVDMPADFRTFQDGDLLLEKGGDLDKDVDFDTDDVDTTENASISFVVKPQGDVHLTVAINGNTVVNAQPFSSTAGRAWRENFQGSFLKNHNTLTVSKNSDGASVNVSDFIVHFKTL
jgi:hypothetical protein